MILCSAPREVVSLTACPTPCCCLQYIYISAVHTRPLDGAVPARVRPGTGRSLHFKAQLSHMSTVMLSPPTTAPRLRSNKPEADKASAGLAVLYPSPRTKRRRRHRARAENRTGANRQSSTRLRGVFRAAPVPPTTPGSPFLLSRR